MNFYIFLLVLHFHLNIHQCKPLQSAGPSLHSYNNTDDKSYTNNSCQRSISYKQVAALLYTNTCPSSEPSNKIKTTHKRTKRQIDAGNFDIKALQTTVNDHRTRIQYLFNNSINESTLSQSLYNHSRTPPSFTSWRDIIDLFCIALVLIIIIYLLLCRSGISICDKLFAFLFRPVINRLQQQQQDQQHNHHAPYTSASTASAPKTTTQHLKSLSSIADSVHQFKS